MFTGFPEETIQFFLDIRFHNSISYFEENRERFRQDVQAPFYTFIEELAPAMRKIDPQMELRPYKCLSRIRRDTRFTKDKSPYRDHLWVQFHRAGEPREGGLFYWFELGPTWMDWGVGLWGENRPVMDLLRRQMAAQPQRFQDILDSCDLPGHHFSMGTNSYKRMAVPEQIPPSLRPLYTARSVYFSREDAPLKWAFDARLTDRVLKDYRALAPAYRMLRGIYDEQAQAELNDNGEGER